MLPYPSLILAVLSAVWLFCCLVPWRIPLPSWASLPRLDARWTMLVVVLLSLGLTLVDQVEGTSLPLGFAVAGLDLVVAGIGVLSVASLERYLMGRLNAWEGCVGRRATVTSQRATRTWGQAEIVLPGGLPAVVPVRCYDPVAPQRGMLVEVVGRTQDGSALEVVTLVECGDDEDGNH